MSVNILVIVLIIVLLMGTIGGYSGLYGDPWVGYGHMGGAGILFVIVLLLLLF